jgi:hypothetical protein
MRKRRLFILGIFLLLMGIAFAAYTRSSKRHFQSQTCASTMVSITFAARMWAHDHEGKLPSDFLAMTSELSTPKVLHCPADDVRPKLTNWSSLSPSQSSYEIVGADLRLTETNGVFLRCRIHGHLGYTDATVFDGIRRRGKY